MERSEEALRERVRETPLSERLKTCEKYVASMCAERRPPKMTIPLQHYDEDFYIYTTLADAQAAIAALQARVQKLELRRTPTHGSCCTCQRCGMDYDSCRCSLDDVCDELDEVKAQLTQRTAELEAANEKVQFLEKKNRNLLDSENLTLKVKADQDVRLASLQAELERVRGERDKLQSEVDGWELGSRGFP